MERLRRDPGAVASFLGFEDDGIGVVEVRPKGLLGWILRLLPITITEVDPRSVEDAAPSRGDETRVIDLDKAWHGLHFLFTGTAEGGDAPACYLLDGGESLDDEGMARLLNPDQVRSFSALLAGLTASALESRFDAGRMNELDIYPGPIWGRTDEAGESPLEWLLGCFQELNAFVAGAAEAGDGMVVHLG